MKNAKQVANCEHFVEQPEETSILKAKLELKSSHLPSPEDLEKYNYIIPDGASRIMAMAEKEQDNRHIVTNKTINIEIIYVAVSVLLLILCLTNAAILAFKGADYKIVGFFLGIPVLTAITSLIKKIPGRKSK